MNKTELKPNVEAHAHNPVLRRHEGLKLKGSLCCILSSNTVLVIVSQNIRKQLTRTNKTKPRPPKNNQPNEQNSNESHERVEQRALVFLFVLQGGA